MESYQNQDCASISSDVAERMRHHEAAQRYAANPLSTNDFEEMVSNTRHLFAMLIPIAICLAGLAAPESDSNEDILWTFLGTLFFWFMFHCMCLSGTRDCHENLRSMRYCISILLELIPGATMVAWGGAGNRPAMCGAGITLFLSGVVHTVSTANERPSNRL